MSGKPDAPTSPTHPNPKQPTNPHLQIQPLTLLQKKSCAAAGNFTDPPRTREIMPAEDSLR